MAKKQVVNATPNVAGEFTKLFGPPALFNTEDIVIYAAILEGLAEDEKPRSFIARILIRDVADLVYQRLWLRNLGTRLIRHVHAEGVRRYASHVRQEADNRKRRLHENNASAPIADSDSEQALKAEIEKIDAETGQTMIRLSKAINGPVEDAALFVDWIERYERVQGLLAAADKKFSDTLKLLDEYRHGLAQRVRQVADEITDVDFEERSPPACAHQRVLAGSSIAGEEKVTPAKAMLRPAVPHPASVQRRRRSASSSLGRAQSKATSSGEAQPGKVAALDQKKSDQ
jgi:hypothetical protein